MKIHSRYEYDPEKDLLGRGGFARVYRAIDTLLDRIVALKIFSNTGHQYSVLQEIKKVIQFEHPNLLRYYDVLLLDHTNALGETEQLQIGVMEYANAGDLKDFARTHPGSPLLYKLLKDVLRGLEYLHGRGIIHRDLKAQNILLVGQGDQLTAKISDFGISKDTGAGGKSSSMMVGTIEYMAPEQFSPQKYGIDGKVSSNLDLWSFGIMVHELLTDATPFGCRDGDTTAEQIMSSILSAELPGEIDTLPEPYRSVVRRCLVTDARQRIRQASELLRYFEEGALPSAKAEDDTKLYPKDRSSQPDAAQDPVKGDAEADATRVYPKQEPATNDATTDPNADGATKIYPKTGTESSGAKPKAFPLGRAIAIGASAALLVVGGLWAHEDMRAREQLAKEQLAVISEAWSAAQATNTVAGYEAFLSAYADSEPAAAAKARLTAAREREAQAVRERMTKDWAQAQKADTAKAWQEFLDTYPNTPQHSEAQQRLAVAQKREAESVAWAQAQGSNSVEGWKEFLTRYPGSSNASVARRRLAVAEATFRDCPACPEMVVLPAGSFEMGDLHGDGSADEKPVRTVRIGQAFAMGKYEVTQGEWRAVMGNNPSHFKNCGDRCPVDSVSWDDVQDFIRRLNAKTGKHYRLPSEAEWEYACRAGGRHKWCGSDSADGVAWHSGNSGDKTHAVGGKNANDWGLHDMSGNQFEWVQECGRYYYESTNCSDRMARGGSAAGEPADSRSANRAMFEADDRSNGLGFRLSRTLQ